MDVLRSATASVIDAYLAKGSLEYTVECNLIAANEEAIKRAGALLVYTATDLLGLDSRYEYNFDLTDGWHLYYTISLPDTRTECEIASLLSHDVLGKLQSICKAVDAVVDHSECRKPWPLR